ncbi:hypothetical protein I4U23_023148 [Adineta vaga]|nr:hypothetical protein I4U23_023148 [Adineta vaga]
MSATILNNQNQQCCHDGINKQQQGHQNDQGINVQRQQQQQGQQLNNNQQDINRQQNHQCGCAQQFQQAGQIGNEHCYEYQYSIH